MDQRMLVNLGAATVPVLFGAIWYNPYLLGMLWPVEVGLNKERITPGKLALIVVLTYAAGYYIARTMGGIVIHQHGLYSMLAGVPDMKDSSSELSKTVQGLMDKYGNNFRTFNHGAYHGMWTGLYFAFPIILITGLVESKKVSWILIHSLFWMACLVVMGGIVCAYMP
jgi:hypothetical protein